MFVAICLWLGSTCTTQAINEAISTWQVDSAWTCPNAQTSTVLELSQFITEGCNCPFIPPEMLVVSAGDFLRGCDQIMDDECQGGRETPQTLITMPEFQISKYHITFADYTYFINSGSPMVNGRTVPDDGMQPLNFPVFKVNKYDAAAYCNWLSMEMGYTPVYSVAGNFVIPLVVKGTDGNILECNDFCHVSYPIDTDWNADGFRLPSEAEWEKAARGTDGRKYPWGAECPWDPVYRANYKPGGMPAVCANMDSGDADGFSLHGPVGSYAEPSPYGLYDMAGNVADWVNDYYVADYYASSPSVDPQGPDPAIATESSGIYRGGSYDSRADELHTYDRLGNFVPSQRNNRVGFRVVRRDVP